MIDNKKPELISREELVETIRSVTIDVFSTMLNLVITPGEVQIEPSTAAASGIVSLVGMAGNWAGTGCLACTGPLACKLSSQFLMTPFESVNEDVLDAIGELTNMVIGNVKTHLEEHAGPMGLSTPTVIYGRNFQTRSARTHDWTVVPFLCGEERLHVQVCLAPNQTSDRGTLRGGFQVPQVLHI